jgi:HEPN domain-containing protein
MTKLEQTDLDDIIFRLTSTYLIDQIFLWTFEWENQARYMLQILMCKGGGQTFTDANIYMGTVVKEYDNIDYVVCYPHEIQKKIKQGLGRAVLICQPENLVYEHPKAHEKIKIPDVNVGSLVEKNEQYLQKEIKKISAFLEGYSFYLDNANFQHAAFMLHQVVELAYRTAEYLLVGDERRTHCLKTHQNYLAKYSTQLGNLFRAPEQRHIIDKLDDAYSSVRYDQDFKIKRKYLESAHQLTGTMLTWLTDYSAFLLQEIKEKLSPLPQISINLKSTTTMKTTINTDHRDLILNAIETYCTPTTVRSFGYRQQFDQSINLLNGKQDHQEVHHYHLLILHPENQISIPLQNFQNAVEQLLPEYIRTTFLVFEHGHFQKQCDKSNTFHTILLQQSDLWHENQQHSITLPDNLQIAPINLNELKILWMKTHRNAEHLYHAHTEDLYFGSEEVACYGLALALEQACLGLMRVFWQFQPQSTNLNYLMRLCNLICPKATSVFVLDHPGQYAIFKLLVDAQQQFRHAPNYRTQGQHLEVLAERVEQFIEVAHNAVETYFSAEINTVTQPEQEQAAKEELCA